MIDTWSMVFAISSTVWLVVALYGMRVNNQRLQELKDDVDAVMRLGRAIDADYAVIHDRLRSTERSVEEAVVALERVRTKYASRVVGFGANQPCCDNEDPH